MHAVDRFKEEQEKKIPIPLNKNSAILSYAANNSIAIIKKLPPFQIIIHLIFLTLCLTTHFIQKLYLVQNAYFAELLFGQT